VHKLRLAIIGFGTVGRWLAAAVHRRREFLEQACGTSVSLVAAAMRGGGYIRRDEGFDIEALLAHAAAKRPLAAFPGARWSPSAAQGFAETACDVLAEASNTDPRRPEPALGHIRAALERGIAVVTSSKGACAAAALDLMALARRRGTAFRMESTVMSGTPVLSTIAEGLAGARVLALRGIVNGTANHILTRMHEGLDYLAALADAQALGYAEPDPANDVDGHDAVAKTRILAAVAFGRALALDEVACTGIAGLERAAVERAARDGARLKLVASLKLRDGALEARVAPLALPLTDPLARIDGVMNALMLETDTVRELIIAGPGAGPEQAGQGIFADFVAVARGAPPSSPLAGEAGRG
jgi:homoserine dehydrogenase